MNLSDFPISVLQRQQPTAADGIKIDSVSYESSRYDSAKNQRVKQRVVLETNSRHGLPTPADENVVLALLFVAKHSSDFSDPIVHFSPRQLFRIMGWAPNSRSYERLRSVLRRLKALVIRYENSWWDAADRGYEAEFATGIVAEYELGRQVAGRKKNATKPPNWIRWAPHFHESLARGNLKKLNLEQLFALRLPTSQRLYRFLDKRFFPRHQPRPFEMDLVDFACGHIGLRPTANVAELKRRLAPALKELQEIGFIQPVDRSKCFKKQGPGSWRVHLEAGPAFQNPRGPSNSLSIPKRSHPDRSPLLSRSTPRNPEAELVRSFYRLWNQTDGPIGVNDALVAKQLLDRHGPDKARAITPILVKLVRRHWPSCKSFSGACIKYLTEAITVIDKQEALVAGRATSRANQRAESESASRLEHTLQALQEQWDALPRDQRDRIESDVLRLYPDTRDRPGILLRLCLDRLV